MDYNLSQKFGSRARLDRADSELASKEPQSWGRAVVTCCAETTVHAMPRVVDQRRSAVLRAMWFLAFLASFSYFVVIFQSRVALYLEFGVVTEVRLDRETALAFPVVTFCNLNPFKASQVESYLAGRSANTTLTPTKELMLTSGHQLEDLLVHCRYQGRTCGPSDFVKFHDPSVNVCHSFNAKGDVPKTPSAGKSWGLEMLLNVEAYEYVPTTLHAGIGMDLHEQGSQPSPDNGIFLAPGMATIVRTKKKIVSNLPHPYSDCVENVPPFSHCIRRCLYDVVQVTKCGCSEDISSTTSPRLCDMSVEADFTCLLASEVFDETEWCDCSVPCETVEFEVDAASIPWPAPEFAKVMTGTYNYSTVLGSSLQEAFRQTFTLPPPPPSSKLGDRWTDATIRQNLVAVSIFYKHMNVERIHAQPAYDFFSLFSELGGSLGLLVGASCLTVIEICELSSYPCRRNGRRRRAAVGPNREATLKRLDSADSGSFAVASA